MKVEMTGITKAFKGVEVLKLSSLSITSGQIVALVGPNGAGKTTLLKLMTQLLLPETGRIDYYLDRKCLGHPKRHIKYVQESGQGYYDYMTANQNIAYFLSLNKTKDYQMAQEDLFDQFRFEFYQDRQVASLSQGNRQKLALITALLSRPSLLCLDEPTNGLDTHGKKVLGEVLTHMSQQDSTVVLTTHDLDFVGQYVHRVITLSDGLLVKDEQLLRASSSKGGL